MKVLRFEISLVACIAAALTVAAVAGLPCSVAADPPGASPATSGEKKAVLEPPSGDPHGPDLYFAIRQNDPEIIVSVLKRGADINGTNWLGITPLMWGAFLGNDAACATLLANGAALDTDTAYGGPLEAAEMGGNPRIVKRLLDRGARFSKNRSDKTNTVILAAEAGHTEVLQMLLKRKAKVNAPDVMGMTAITHASRRGHVEVVRMLLTAKAAVNTGDAWGRTPLMYAAMNGHVGAVRALLTHGASVNAKDRKGETALFLAARYSGDPEIARLLVGKGANTAIRDSRGRTAGDLAASRGYTGFNGTGAVKPHRAIAPGLPDLPGRARQAVERSLPLIEKTTANFTGTVGCNSCHHQGVGLITTGTAKLHGYLIDKFGVEQQTKAVMGETESHIGGLRDMLPHPEKYKHLPTIDMEEFSPAVSASFTGLAQHAIPANEATAAMATILARQQREDGSWGFGIVRAPVQSSAFMTTAYSIRVLNVYLPEALAEERKNRIGKATSWLLATPAKDGEDHAFRLLALKWANAPAAEIAREVAAIKSLQRRDGGWAQFPVANPTHPGYSRSDAYATGQALYALYIGGEVDPKDATYRRGAEYLLRTQDDDGSWFVNKRAIPVNNYLDTGFPHGVSQYISYTGTCWATMALIFAAEPPRRPNPLATR